MSDELPREDTSRFSASLEQVRGYRAGYCAHVGRIITLAAEMEQLIQMLLIILVLPSQRGSSRLQAMVAPLGLRQKIEMLNAALPQQWNDAKKLVRLLNAVQEYRNAVAHGGVDLDISKGRLEPVTLARSSNSWRRGHRSMPIQMDQLQRYEDESRFSVHILLDLVFAMQPLLSLADNEPAKDEAICTLSIRALFSDESEESAAGRSTPWRAILAQYFPPADG